MFMLAEQLEYDEETVVKLERLNLFLGLFYTPMWMSSTLAADAPANDLQFMKDMMKFKRTDPEIAQAVLQNLKTTSGYLNRRLCRSLSSVADSVTKEADIAAKVHATESQIASDEGKTHVSLRLQPRATLADLVWARESSSA
ncbi:hypothetical protein GWK47_038348 [Chionoecetes opilio]|uniref:Uncharacterized protein n=1 Tax=Chionoecetes opilio TaxID=41210 RepID=A0A8J4YCS5_CHIOP|nr:hypothetical protein GWK47_038348 [Chionoecetes opilio]